MRGPLSKRRLIPTSTPQGVARRPDRPAPTSAIGDSAQPAGVSGRNDVCLVHVTQDGPYAARVRDVLEAFHVSVSTENLSMLDADSPRLREPERLIIGRHRLTVVLASESFELFNALNGPTSNEFVRRLAIDGERCLIAALDETHVAELAPLQAAAVQNGLREPSDLLVAIKKRLDSLELADRPSPVASDDASAPGDQDASQNLAEISKYKPAGWRTTLQAAAMVDELRRLEPKREGHDLGRQVPGLRFGRYEASNFLQDTVLPDLEGFLKKFSRQITLIRANSSSEDVVRVERTARELVGISEALLDWAARIRGTDAPASWSSMIRRAATLSDSMLASVDEFVDAYSQEAQRLRDDPDYDGSDVSVTLKFDLDSDVLDQLLKDYKKVHRG